ncbi:hypothetical protein Tco_0885031 [Tanacetum coccineum]
MLEGNGPKWLFDIDSLTQSMNYVPITAGTITNESIGIQGEHNVVPYIENDEKDKYKDDSSHKEVNTVGQHVNTASPKDKYVVEILKKFNYTDVNSASTPVDLEKTLVKERDADDVDCLCWRPLKIRSQQLKVVMFFGKQLISLAELQSKLHGCHSLMKLKCLCCPSCYGQVSGFKIICLDYRLFQKSFDARKGSRHVKKGRDTKIPQSSGPPVKVGDEAVHKELGDRMERDATTASSLEAEELVSGSWSHGAKIPYWAGAVTTASASISTVSPPRVSTTEDISESEPPKKIKKRVQVQVSIDEELAKKVFEEEQAKAKAEQEQQKFDFEIALELQRQLDEREEVELMILIGNQGRYKMSHFKGMSYEEIRPIFERVWDQIQSFVPMDSEKEKGSEKKTEGRLKRAGQDVVEEPAKRQKTTEASELVQEQPNKDSKVDELSQEHLQQIMLIVPEEGMHIEALQIKYPIIDSEVHSEDTMKFWKIIRVGNHTKVYQVFEDMLKNFDKEDLDKLWSLVKERFNSQRLTDDKEKELWIELKRLFEPDDTDTL